MGHTGTTGKKPAVIVAFSTHPASFTHQTEHLKREISHQVFFFAQDGVLFAVPDIGALLLLVRLENARQRPLTFSSLLKNGSNQFWVTFPQSPKVDVFFWYFFTHRIPEIVMKYGSLTLCTTSQHKQMPDTVLGLVRKSKNEVCTGSLDRMCETKRCLRKCKEMQNRKQEL